MRIEIGDPVKLKFETYNCLCGDEQCRLMAGERYHVAARRHFPGLGWVFALKERPVHTTSNHPPYYLISAFVPYTD